MATLTKEQIEQLKQQLVVKIKELKAIENQLIEAGELEVPEELVDQVAGGRYEDVWTGGYWIPIYDEHNNVVAYDWHEGVDGWDTLFDRKDNSDGSVQDKTAMRQYAEQALQDHFKK